MIKKYFAYHMKHKFGAFNKSWILTDKTNVKEGDELYVISGDKGFDGKNVYFLEGLFTVSSIGEDKHKIEDKNGEYASFNFKLYLEEKVVPFKSLNLNDKDGYDKDSFHNYFSSGQGINTINPKYIAWFDKLLLDSAPSDSEVSNDIKSIYESSDDLTERDTLIKARIGQGVFRKNVIETWGLGEKCLITGIDIKCLLVASHIRPWSKCNGIKDRLDGANGLLLSSNIDKLFDNHLISFENKSDELELVINKKQLPISLAKKLGIQIGQKIPFTNVGLTNEENIKKYMKEHYSTFLEKSS
tara:strand:+ start:15992 stop:16891 length:900 start_codon:yes stop_codon:yes gene_type:complete